MAASRGTPTIRKGFVGLTDILAWLTQTGPGDTEADEYRLAQLFRPGQATVSLFRVAVAVMRGQSWSLPVVALFAFSLRTRLLAALLLVGAIVLTGFAESRLTQQPHALPALIGLGALGVVAFAVTIAGVLLTVQGLRSALRRPDGPTLLPHALRDRLRRYASSSALPAPATHRQLIPGVLAVVAVATLAGFRPALYLTGLVVGLAASLILVAVLLREAVGYLGRFQERRYGLVPGTTPQRPRTALDVLAGVPKPTVDLSVVPWLDHCLNALAGLPETEVLRFGHLWSGLDYHRDRADRSLSGRWPTLSRSPDDRLVNLELMTTDLTRQRPFRFPLPAWDHGTAEKPREDPEQLWVCVDQLRDGESQMFPDRVLDVLRETPRREVPDGSGGTLVLHQLPQPWDLPVIFAVRISMSLPALFQAVRLYRVSRPTEIQDDYGRTLRPRGQTLAARSTPDPVQVLWFSDGGITSNFPVHFFDNALPRWPTVSLNLGSHPDDSPHQDIGLPQDWDDPSAPTGSLTRSGLSFAGAIFNTAMSWRDSLQSALPGYRNRIAQVRTGPGEGGTNLFMSREVIASLALRGAFAGARLRTRFHDRSQWNRFRWLRLRIAMSNLERLRASTQERRGFYADAFTGRPWLKQQEATFADAAPSRAIDWYDPRPDFWPLAPRLLTTFADGYRAPADPAQNVMCHNVPRPEPVLRPVPKE